MSKITLSPVNNLIDATTAKNTINSNSAIVQTAMNNTLSRDGTTPNTMGAVIDMNNNQILNLPVPATQDSPLRLKDLNSFVGGGAVSNIPPGGTAGQVLTKRTGTDYDIDWEASGSLIYYVSPTGNDSNTGLSTGAPWQTISKVNSSSFNPNTVILFQGNQTFTGTIEVSSGGTAANSIVYGSYGGGRATISSGNDEGLISTNFSGITVRDLIFTGTPDTTHGITFDNTLGGNVHLQNIQIINCDVSGYGLNGIFITGSNGSAGYDDVLINGCTVSNCCGVTSINGDGTAAIYVHSDEGFGLRVNDPSFSNVIISNCNVNHNTGAADVQWTGSGIVIAQTNKGLIYNCIADTNGLGSVSSSGSGPGAIWTFDSKYITIDSCTAINNGTGNTADGGAFDLDGGVAYSSIRNCISKNNMGEGYFFISFSDPDLMPSDGNSIINCSSENDGSVSGTSNNASLIIDNQNVLTNFTVYGCTFYQTNPSADLVRIVGNGGVTGNIVGNTFVINGTQFFINAFEFPTGIVFNGNKYYSAGDFAARWNSQVYNDLSSFSSTGNETNGLQFTNDLITGDITANGTVSAVDFLGVESSGSGDALFDFDATPSGGKEYIFFSTGSANGAGPGKFVTYDASDNYTISVYSNSGGANNLDHNASELLRWGNDNFATAPDVGIGRNTNGILEVNNGNPANFSDLKVRDLYFGNTAPTGTTAYVRATSPTLITPALGTPSALVGTNITGTASGLTAGHVTTNANLTGPITSTGNATSIASQTGTGTTFAMSAGPTFTGTVTHSGATTLSSALTYGGITLANSATGSGSMVLSSSPAITGGVITNGTIDNAAIGSTTASTGKFTTIAASTSVLSNGSGGVGYATGAGGAVTQITSRATGVTLSKVSGSITLLAAINAAVSPATAVTITVTNTTVAATDTIIVNQKSGTDKYLVFVTAVAAGSFNITWYTTGGVTNESPVFNFTVHKGVNA